MLEKLKYEKEIDTLKEDIKDNNKIKDLKAKIKEVNASV
jgi:hypothetical protein